MRKHNTLKLQGIVRLMSGENGLWGAAPKIFSLKPGETAGDGVNEYNYKTLDTASNIFTIRIIKLIFLINLFAVLEWAVLFRVYSKHIGAALELQPV